MANAYMILLNTLLPRGREAMGIFLLVYGQCTYNTAEHSTAEGWEAMGIFLPVGATYSLDVGFFFFFFWNLKVFFFRFF